MTKPVLQLLDNTTFVCDNSTYKVMTACATMGDYKVLHKRERAAVAIERDVGKTAHAALEYRYKTFKSAPVTLEGEQTMLDIFEKEYNELGDIPEDTYLTLSRVKDVLCQYNKTYGREPFEVIATEIPLAFPLGTIRTSGKHLPLDLHIIWSGRSDLLVRYDDDGKAYNHDHKFTKEWGDKKQASYEVDDAQKGYAWMVQKMAKAYPELGLPARVHGFCVSGIVMRPDLKRPSKDGFNLPRTEFHRSRVLWTEENLTEWRENVLANLETWFWLYEKVMSGEKPSFPRNRSQCAMYFGKKCGYWDVCQAPAHQREMILGMDLYKNVTWEPLHRVE